MAYNRRNILSRIIDVQEITLREKEHGATQVWIFHNIIEKTYKISYTTYKRYLATPARKELKQLNIK